MLQIIANSQNSPRHKVQTHHNELNKGLSFSAIIIQFIKLRNDKVAVDYVLKQTN